MESFPSLFLVMISFMGFRGISGEVQILIGPEDVRVEEGATAKFPCVYNGTISIPFWKINGIPYAPEQLPHRHIYSYPDQTLVVTDVVSSLNLTTYQCIFFLEESSVGILTVLPGNDTSKNEPTVGGTMNLMNVSTVTVWIWKSVTGNDTSKNELNIRAQGYYGIFITILIITILIITGAGVGSLMICIYMLLSRKRFRKTPRKDTEQCHDSMSDEECPKIGVLDGATLKRTVPISLALSGIDLGYPLLGCDHKEKLKILQEARHRTCYSADEIMIACSYSLTISDGNRSRYYGALDSSNVPLSLTYDEKLSNEVCNSSKSKMRPVRVFPQATLCTDFSACAPIVSSWQTTTGGLMPITDKEYSDNNDRSWSVTIVPDRENSYLVPFLIQSEEIHECTTEYQFVQPQYESQIHYSNTACDDFDPEHTSSWGCANKSLVKSDIPKDWKAAPLFYDSKKLEDESEYTSTYIYQFHMTNWPKGSSIDKDDAKALVEHCTILKTLDLSHYPIGADAKALAEGLKTCTNLQTLNLSSTVRSRTHIMLEEIKSTLDPGQIMAPYRLQSLPNCPSNSPLYRLPNCPSNSCVDSKYRYSSTGSQLRLQEMIFEYETSYANKDLESIKLKLRKIIDAAADVNIEYPISYILQKNLLSLTSKLKGESGQTFSSECPLSIRCRRVLFLCENYSSPASLWKIANIPGLYHQWIMKGKPQYTVIKWTSINCRFH